MSTTSPIGAQYTFLPYLRRGLSAYFVAPAGVAPSTISASIPTRAQLNVNLTVSSVDVNNNPLPGGAASNTIALYGPGDITGFNPDHVIRTDPVHLSSSFEPDYFPCVEFDQPDFHWLFSPMSAPDPSQNQQLWPWIVLVVLADGEFTATSGGSGPSYLDILDASVLPNLADSWCWAHTQATGATVSGDISTPLTNNPSQFISRLLCPRHLVPNTHYTGFVVPAFDAGVAVGLGQALPTGSTLNPAWPNSGAIRLPYYFGGPGVFEFTTSAAGDFESLVRLMKPQASAPSVGTRPMSVTGSGSGWVSDDPSAAPMQLGGALQSDLTVPPWTDGASFQSDLGTLLTETAGYAPQSGATGDPMIGPSFYGRWHTGVRTIGPTDTGWLEEVNLDPRNRAVAGFGIWVVLKERNQLMRSAWQQLQYVQQANQRLRSMQMARGAMRELYRNNFGPAGEPTLVAITQTVQGRVLMNGASVASTVAASALPWRLITAAGRRLLRPYGPLRHQGPTTGTPYDILQSINDGTTPLVPPTQPQGSISYTGELTSLYPSWIPTWMDPYVPYLTWILLVLLFLIVVVVFLAAGPVAAGVALAILLGLLGWLWGRITQAQQTGQSINNVLPQNLGPGTFTNAAPQSTFGVVNFGTSPIASSGPAGSPGTDSPTAANFRQAAANLFSVVQKTQTAVSAITPPGPLSFSGVQGALLTGLNPETTLVARAKMLVHLDPSLGWPSSAMDPLEPVMAYPKFDQPMYVPLRDWSQEILMPGISAVPDNSMTLLEENHAFIEAYMLGLNVEMGRQLLWNGFPTDQRGSCFRQFWDISAVYPQPTNATQRNALYDIPPIDQWSIANDLGDNVNAGQPASVVLLLRGQLLKRYPTTHIYACPAQMAGGQPELAGGGSDPTQHVLPVYRGTLSPDVTFIGFPLSESDLLTGGPFNQGYFFVFEQVPGELRFGLEPATAVVATVTSWAQLSWANLPTPATGAVQYASPAQALSGVGALTGADANYKWDVDSAATAYITFRPPARVAVLAATMLNLKPGWVEPSLA